MNKPKEKCVCSQYTQEAAYKTTNFPNHKEILIAVLSPRPYPKGCIVNPSKIIRELIAARREM